MRVAAAPRLPPPACYRSSAMRTVTERDRISLDELRRRAAARFGDMVKAVVDIERRIMIVDADLQADQEAELLAEGSRQENLCVDEPATRERIADLVQLLVSR